MDFRFSILKKNVRNNTMRVTLLLALVGIIGCNDRLDSPLDGSWTCSGSTTVDLVISQDTTSETDSTLTLNKPASICGLPELETLNYLLNCQFVNCPKGPNQLFLSVPSTSVEKLTVVLYRQ